MRHKRPPKRRRMSLIQVIALLVSAMVGLLILSRKLSAQPAPAGATRTASVASARPAPPPPGSAKPASVEVVDAGAKPAAVADAAAPEGDGGYENPLDYAEEREEKDLDPDLSPEQRRALGVGMKGVLIHRDGRFRSPFAHPKFGGPAHAKVGLVLANVRDYDIQKGSFQADFFVTITSDKDMPPVNLSLTNGHEDAVSKLADKPTFKLWRYLATFDSDVDLHKFPFDTQHLAIELEAENIGVDQLVLEPDPDHTSLDGGFFVAGWDVSSIGATARKHYYPARFPHDDLYYSRYTFTLGLERFGTSAIFSVYVPAIVIVLISLLGVWVTPDEMEVRSNAGAPMLAGAVLFHFSLMQALPATGYLTRADKLMVAVYVSLLLNMISTWCFFLVEEDKHMLVFRIARVIVPIATVAVMAAGMSL